MEDQADFPERAPADGDGSDTRGTLLRLWLAVRKRWVVIATLSVLTTLGAVLLTLGQTRIYQASAVVIFEVTTPRPLGDAVDTTVDVNGQFYWRSQEYYKTQAWILRSQRIALAVVQQLELHKDAGFLSQAAPGETPPPREMSPEAAAAKLAAAVTVEPVKESRLTTVRYTDADPERARRILQALVDTYVQKNLDELTQASAAAADWLHGQMGTLKSELEASEMALHEYKRAKNILSVSMDDQSNMLRAELQQLGLALTGVRAKIEAVVARRAELAKVDTADPANIPASELLSSTALQGMRSQYVAAGAEIATLAGAGKGDDHPEVKAARARQATAREAVVAEVANIRGALDHDLAALRQEAGGLKRLSDEAQTRALELNLLEIEYNRLKRSKENNERLASLVMEKTKDTDLTKTLRINNIRVVENASQPKYPISPNVPANIGGGLLLGLLLGLGYAVGREQLDRSVKTPEDAERELGLAFLGMLPAM
ncbi:MAG: protein tyrosine kinase, partial [Deltaproteobacteria bacterium]|nr:protein tyrosine kinase [Deltaproteobacteria bacterium]